MVTRKNGMPGRAHGAERVARREGEGGWETVLLTHKNPPLAEMDRYLGHIFGIW